MRTQGRVIASLTVAWMVAMGIYLWPQEAESWECSGVEFVEPSYFGAKGTLIEGWDLDKCCFDNSRKIREFYQHEITAPDKGEIIKALVNGHERQSRINAPHPGGWGYIEEVKPNRCVNAVNEPGTIFLILIGAMAWIRKK